MHSLNIECDPSHLVPLGRKESRLDTDWGLVIQLLFSFLRVWMLGIVTPCGIHFHGVLGFLGGVICKTYAARSLE